LEQQYRYAQDQLAAAAAEDLKSGKEGKRSRLNQTIDRLEDNIDLAQKEVKDFVPERRRLVASHGQMRTLREQLR
jgi:hypothetical protein